MTNPTDPIRFTLPDRPKADPKRKLGRGLGALLGETQREEPLVRADSTADAAPAAGTPADGALASLPVAAIEPLPGQPRTRFDEAKLDELAASIAARGVIQPILVRPLGAGRYQLVAGERRWRAAQKARLHQIPAIVRELAPREVMALALIENLQREDLNPVEEARAYHRLAQDEGMTQAEIARLVEKSRSHVANIQRLLALPAEVLDLVEEGTLSMGHARALIGHERAGQLARQAVTEGLSVRAIERLARAPAVERTARQTRGTAADNADIAAVERHLAEFLGLEVRIKAEADPSRGQVAIRYTSLDQLDLICQKLTGGEF